MIFYEFMKSEINGKNSEKWEDKLFKKSVTFFKNYEINVKYYDMQWLSVLIKSNTNRCNKLLSCKLLSEEDSIFFKDNFMIKLIVRVDWLLGILSPILVSEWIGENESTEKRIIIVKY